MFCDWNFKDSQDNFISIYDCRNTSIYAYFCVHIDLEHHIFPYILLRILIKMIFGACFLIFLGL